jgi:diguanylate cyclase (GGDEF)-like protein
MKLLSRHGPRPAGGAAHVVERPPRLVLRFAVITALALGLGAAAILVFMRHLDTVQAERSAAAQAQFVAENVLSADLRASDLTRPVTTERREELDRLLRQKVLTPGTVLATLSRPDRLVTYSTDHRLIGTSAADAARTRDALAGTVTSEVTSIPQPGAGRESLKALRSHVPLTVGGVTGVATIYQDYGPIEREAAAALVPVAGILELVLVLLFALMLPLLVRVSRRLRRYVDRIQHQALHDDLTELPNRLQFRDRIAHDLETARRNGSHVAVLVLDVDRFRDVNETLGHHSGDELLIAVAARLRACVGERGLLARLGGDEFGVVASLTRDGALEHAQEIRSTMEEPFTVADVPLIVEASVGIAVCPENGDAVESLLQTADAAMHDAKDRRVGVVAYDGVLDESTKTALTLVGELRPALARNELVLHYQPQVALETGSVVGAEALVRWQHPERGLLQPGAFVPFVERTGASRALSSYVLQHAVGQVRAWRDQGLDIGVAVNLTMFDLLDAAIPEEVATLLERTGLEPHRLELEITESVIMSEPTRVREVLARLKAIGVALAIDDFGTGYSSLRYLKTLPVDILKIDRSFVMAMETSEQDRAIVRSTIELAHNLGLAVVAEGVDSAATLKELARYGCDFAQGFHLARPCPADEFLAAAAAIVAPRRRAVAAAG